MPNKVIGLIYCHDGDHSYRKRTSSLDKALLRHVTKALTEKYDHKVGITFGDDRGRDSQGNTVRAYALRMQTEEHEVDWLYQTFWGVNATGWKEEITGVGYETRGRGKCPMHEFDASQGTDEVKRFLNDVFGIEWSAPVAKPSKAVQPDAGRLRSTVDDDDPFMAMDIDELRQLLATAGVAYEEGDSQKMLRQLYLQALEQ